VTVAPLQKHIDPETGVLTTGDEAAK